MRALLDASLLISFLLSSPSRPSTIGAILDAALRRAYALLLPPELLPALQATVSGNPYLAARIPRERIQRFATLLGAVAEELAPLEAPPVSVCRDREDDYLFAYAEAGQADYLVSGDKDILVLADVGFPFKIVSPAEFLAVLRTERLI